MGGVGLCEYYVREYVPVHYSTSAGVCSVVVFDSCVGFYFAYMCCVAFCVSFFDDAIGVCE
jgi:hypothetical protein